MLPLRHLRAERSDAKALTSYLRWERPPTKGTVRLFLTKRMPHEPIIGVAIRHRIRFYATQAGVSSTMIGAYAVRSSVARIGN